MNLKIEATAEGLIKIKSSRIINVKRPNSLSACKFLGEFLILNARNIVFLGYDNDGNVTYFLTNKIEISVNIFYQEATDIFYAAMSGKNLNI